MAVICFRITGIFCPYQSVNINETLSRQTVSEYKVMLHTDQFITSNLRRIRHQCFVFYILMIISEHFHQNNYTRAVASVSNHSRRFYCSLFFIFRHFYIGMNVRLFPLTPRQQFYCMASRIGFTG